MSIENNEFTDVMDEISVKNSLISHLERENDELKKRIDICKENHIRYDIKAIDENTELKAELKDMKYYSSEYEKKAKAELKTANDGIDDLNDVLKDMQKESIEQIEDNKELKAELEKVKRCNKTMDGILLERDEQIKELRDSKIEIMTKAQEEIRKLKAELNDLKLND